MELTKIGHVLGPRGDDNRCWRCGIAWSPQSRREVLAMGPCQGTKFWHIEGRDPHMPVPLPTKQHIVYGRTIHPTHRLVYLRGILYCQKCGRRTSSKVVRDLADVCALKPSNVSKHYQLNRMQRGLHPRGGSYAFPSCTDTVPREWEPFCQ